MATPLDRLTYAAAQTARVGWYFGQYMASKRLTRAIEVPPDKRIRVEGPTPDTRTLLNDIRALMETELRQIEAGVLKRPHDLLARPSRLIPEAVRYFQEVPTVARRRVSHRGHQEVYDQPPPGSDGLPRYYRQNFHFQTGGYLTDDSARVYDHQVEVLFGGAADVMRRRALVPIHYHLQRLERPDAARPALLDVATGTGQFLTYVRDTHPNMRVTGLDLSAAYLREARRRLRPFGGARLIEAPGEAIPLDDASQDIVTTIFLFHELPRAVRRSVAAEMARVLKPGGLLVFLDSLQYGDRPDMDGLLEFFPQAFHEPYYTDYIRDDLVGLFQEAGLVLGVSDIAFMSKLLAFEKPV